MRLRLCAVGLLGGAVALLCPAAALADAGWTWPVVGRPTVVHGFELPPEPWLPGHRGVDLAGRPGSAVFAAGAGLVRFAGRIAGVGVVSIRHADGLVTSYEPVVASVRTGAVVHAGQRIGRLAVVGAHCRPTCLHWGLRRGNDYLDPLAVVGAGQVRLLPLHGSDSGTDVPVTGAAFAATVMGAVALRRVSRR